MATTTADILVRTVMTGSTGLPTDVYVNDFAFHHISGVAPTDLELLDLFGAVDGFYNDTQAGGNAVADFISEAVSRSVTHEMEFFTISSGTLGSPRLTEPWLGPVAPVQADNNEPSEVAAVLSFHASLTGIPEESGVTRPKARRRGRVYVGPLIHLSVDSAAPNPLLATALTLVLRQAAVAMYDEALAAGFYWSVWSRADDTLRPVTGGWTDNAPDTQRRRGTESTSRVTFTT